MQLRFKPGAPIESIMWGGPDDLPAESCSLCGTPFDDDEVPFRVMGWRYAAFCDSCFALCFEVEE